GTSGSNGSVESDDCQNHVPRRARRVDHESTNRRIARCSVRCLLFPPRKHLLQLKRAGELARSFSPWDRMNRTTAIRRVRAGPARSPAAEKMRRHRERAARGEACYRVPIGPDVIDFLVRANWLTERDVYRDLDIAEAVAALLRDTARRN